MAPIRGYAPVTSQRTSEGNDARLREFTSPEDITLDPVRTTRVFPRQVQSFNERMLT